jgi:hypothetical protein
MPARRRELYLGRSFEPVRGSTSPRIDALVSMDGRPWVEGQDGKQEWLPHEPTHTMTRFSVALRVRQVLAEKRETQSDWSVLPQSPYPDTKAWEE